MNNWLITYQQWTGNQYKMANRVIVDMLPVHWLLATEKKYPEAQTVLINWTQLDKQTAEEMSDYF